MKRPERRDHITVISRKFDGTVSRSWKCGLFEKSEDLLVFVGEFETEVKHPDLGIIRRGTLSYEYYWLDRWYNVFRFHEPEGQLRNYYCNINMPPTFEDDVLAYIDLDIDVLVGPDLSYKVLDMEEFKLNAERFGYSEDIKRFAKASLDEVTELIELRAFPFDHRG